MRQSIIRCQSGSASTAVSIEKDLLKTYGYPTPESPRALIESALRNVRLLEDFGFYELKISIKSADVLDDH